MVMMKERRTLVMMQERMESSRKEWKSWMRKRITQFGGGNLLRSQIGWLTRVQTNVLLQDESVGELFVANRTDVKEPGRWLGTMNAHMSFAFDSAFVGPICTTRPGGTRHTG